MEIVVLVSQDEIANTVADSIEKLIRDKGEAVLGLATGSSPMPIYEELVRRHKEKGLSFAKVKVFLLDEYLDLPIGHAESYREVVERNFTRRIDIDSNNVFIPDVYKYDIVQACQEYEYKIKDAGGIDIQLLGIGTDGHIGFNEQGSSLVSRTRIKTLTERTRQDNARFFNSITEVPKHVITQGLGTIMEARHIILVAFGIHKAKTIAEAVEGPISASCPASILQMHPHATVIVDEEAATSLQRKNYYKNTYVNKPDWQSL